MASPRGLDERMAARLPNAASPLRKRMPPMFDITLIANRGAIPAFSPAIPAFSSVIPAFSPVIPAKAGIQKAANVVGIRRERDMSARPSPSAHEGA